MFRAISALLVVAILALPSLADQASDLAALRDRFQRLVRSIQNSGGLSDAERPALTALRDDATRFNGSYADDANGVAMELQLSKWLGETERVDSLFPRLLALRPDDGRLALAWLREREARGILADADISREYESLLERFPEDKSLLSVVAEIWQNDLRYPEIIDLLGSRVFDGASDAAPLFALAEAQFAEHHFDDAKSTAGKIDMTAMKDMLLRRRINEALPSIESYPELWAKEQETRAKESAADDLPRAEIHTPRGRIIIELFENEAPNTVANFVKLAESGFWEGTRFHRWEPDFMIQGGDPLSREGVELPAGSGGPGTGGPGYCIPDEADLPGARLHFRDSIAMAKTSAPNSGGSQFYLNHRPTPWLNNIHTVFGRVLEGIDVVRALRKDDRIDRIVITRKRNHAYEPSTLPDPSAAPPPVTPGDAPPAP